MKAHVIRVERTGAPEVMKQVEIDLPEPGPGEARVRQSAIGFNFIDTVHRRGMYGAPVPLVLGNEAAGVVEAVGKGVKEVKPGQRVVWRGRGAYADYANVPAAQLIPLPRGIDEKTAAASLIKGLTARWLVRQVHPLKKTDTVAMYASAGGVGLLFCQWAAKIGATVIGIVGSDAKARLAKANGATHTIVMGKHDIVQRVKKLTDGRGVDVVYDSVGRDTWDTSIDCLKPHGLMVSFGSATGIPKPVDLHPLLGKGAPFITRTSVNNYLLTREDTLAGARELFRMIGNGTLKVRVSQTYPFSAAGAIQMHTDAEARRHTGSVVMVP